MPDLNDTVQETVRDSEVITVPIDPTLSTSGEAADAKAVGDALALKADKSELQTRISVNGQEPDNQGVILISGEDVPVSDASGAEMLGTAVLRIDGKTAADIPLSSEEGAPSVADALGGLIAQTADTMPMSDEDPTTVAAELARIDAAAVKSVQTVGNPVTPDGNGTVKITEVENARQLVTDRNVEVSGSFVVRTTGGDSSVSDGTASLVSIFGNQRHDGYVAEVISMTVTPIDPTDLDAITAVIDNAVFRAYVGESGTYSLYYTTEWTADPELYGITVSGTPAAGDQITVVYVKLDRGVITVAHPNRLAATGWNLYNDSVGYARCSRYSETYGYKILGTYSSLEYAPAINGARTVITPENGLFMVPGDGYLFVTGGDASSTCIFPTWSDWVAAEPTYQAYRESSISLASVLSAHFPAGLLRIGSVYDEINLSSQTAVSRIQRLAYSDEAMQMVIESGRDWDADADYIYVVRETEISNSISVASMYTCAEHGIEYLDGTTVPCQVAALYGPNLKDKLERNVVTLTMTVSEVLGE